MFDFSGHTPALRCPLCRSAAIWNHPIPHQDWCTVDEVAEPWIEPNTGHTHYKWAGRTLCGLACEHDLPFRMPESGAWCGQCIRKRIDADLAALWLQMSADTVDLYLAAEKVLDKEIDNYERIAVKNLMAVMRRMEFRSPLDEEYNGPITSDDAVMVATGSEAK